MTGITTLKYGLTPGLYCSSTGLISQWTTQASDISVLAIAITTFLMMRVGNTPCLLIFHFFVEYISVLSMYFESKSFPS